MNVDVTPEVAQILEERMSSGHYSSPSDVVARALHLLNEHERFLEFLESNRAHIREQIAEGIASLDRGEGVDGDEVFDRLEARLAERARLGNP